jgi:hypothetical protein
LGILFAVSSVSNNMTAGLFPSSRFPPRATPRNCRGKKGAGIIPVGSRQSRFGQIENPSKSPFIKGDSLFPPFEKREEGGIFVQTPIGKLIR